MRHFVILVTLCFCACVHSVEKLPSHHKGLWKEAFESYQQLLSDDELADAHASFYYQQAVECLRRLNRISDIDGFRASTLAQHRGWRCLSAVANSYRTHHGAMIDGVFHRGSQRGTGTYYNSQERDRITSLQLFEEALSQLDGTNHAQADFYAHFISKIQEGRQQQQTWRLQTLSDLSQLPSYDTNYYRHHRSQSGAPTTTDGNPVVYTIPASWKAAQNDGERYRWLLHQRGLLDNNYQNESHYRYADFLRTQWGVHTIRSWNQNGQQDLSHALKLADLSNNETIAKLATGIQQFTLPDGHNYIHILQRLGNDKKNNYAKSAAQALATIYEQRNQRAEAVRWWKEANATDKMKHITGNWCAFEQHWYEGSTAPLLRFRNADRVKISVQPVDMDLVMTTARDYIKSSPQQLDWHRFNVNNFPQQLLDGHFRAALGDIEKTWVQKLSPAKHYMDSVTPIRWEEKQHGVWLITAELPDGNTARLVWRRDGLILIKRNLDKAVWYQVSDAITGQPIPKAHVHFFGFRHKLPRQEFARYADEHGQIHITEDDHIHHARQNLQWLIVAKNPTADKQAWIGFDSINLRSRAPQSYQQNNIYTLTDRPVYRPGQSVEWKLWKQYCTYETETNQYAGQSYTVHLRDPQGQQVFSQTETLDNWGGCSGTWHIPGDARLGIYHIGSTSFRIEEYKKPEFEVNIQAPERPVALGDTITATISAHYYHGAPVRKATVHYRVMRNHHNKHWYPHWRWDWLYGRGASWLWPNYSWHPQWDDWGCEMPWPWWHHQPSQAPEVVLEGDTNIGADGTVQLAIPTALAQRLHGNSDHQYTITAEVMDTSRRTIVGSGSVIAARQAFQVTTWADRGYYHTGSPIQIQAHAQTADGKAVSGTAEIILYRIRYQADGTPQETKEQQWSQALHGDTIEQQITIHTAGQYRINCTITDTNGNSNNGAHIITVYGDNTSDTDFRYNDLELITDAISYVDGDTMQLRINSNHNNAVVWLFLRPENGIYLPPRCVRLTGKSSLLTVPISRADMPNFFIEATLIADGRIHNMSKSIPVPPTNKIMTVTATSDKQTYQPGETAKLDIICTNADGKPAANSSVLVAMYDKSLDYIAGPSNRKPIHEAFWFWRRNHYANYYPNRSWHTSIIYKKNDKRLQYIGLFPQLGYAETKTDGTALSMTLGSGGRDHRSQEGMAMADVTMEASASPAVGIVPQRSNKKRNSIQTPFVEATLRTAFADTALWVAHLETDAHGRVTTNCTIPDNVTTWKIGAWAVGTDAQAGEGHTEIVATKNVLVRLQAPRFFQERDTVVLSANVHNELDTATTARVSLQHDALLAIHTDLEQDVHIPAHSEVRVDWHCTVQNHGETNITISALTTTASDAMSLSFPVQMYGAEITQVASDARRAHDPESIQFSLTVPSKRIKERSSLTLHYSPSIAHALVDALPYLVSYPYGCTEQTLNRFVPTVIVHTLLKNQGIDLATLANKNNNLHAGELGNAQQTTQKHWPHNPVFDSKEIQNMTEKGVRRLTELQNSDGGWGWFAGGHSYPHTTLTVLAGLQKAGSADIALVPNVIENGIAYLTRHRTQELARLNNWDRTNNQKINDKQPAKNTITTLDVAIEAVLQQAGQADPSMLTYIYDDRRELPVYGLCQAALLFHRSGQVDQRTALRAMIQQFVQTNTDNQTAWLHTNNQMYWWYWYGNDNEAHAHFLKLLAATEPQSDLAAGIAKYLLTNRTHGSYWDSTRDTALCIEALAEFVQASKEASPDMDLNISINGTLTKTVHINNNNIFSYDDRLILNGAEIPDGPCTITLERTGTGAVYAQAWLSNFSQEDHMAAEGLDVKIKRQYYRLSRNDSTTTVAGHHGQIEQQQEIQWKRTALKAGEQLAAGERIEIELTIEAANDYEYIHITNPKAAGLEAEHLRSGYQRYDGCYAYTEFRDNRVEFFIDRLSRGSHSISYRMRAEIPGTFAALPASVSGMYAPELIGTSTLHRIQIQE